MKQPNNTPADARAARVAARDLVATWPRCPRHGWPVPPGAQKCGKCLQEQPQAAVDRQRLDT